MLDPETKEIIPNHYTLQIDREKGYAVTLCKREDCRAELRTPFLYTTREKVQEKHDKEAHWYSTEYHDGNCLYVLSCEADSQEHQTKLADESMARLQKGKKSAFPSTSFVKSARSKPRKAPSKSELYEPVDLKPGAMVAFQIPGKPVYRERDVENGYYGWEIDYYTEVQHFKGQVWSEGPKSHPKSIWVVTDDQRAFVVHKESFNVLEEWHRDQ
jgi:hypothetical protein